MSGRERVEVLQLTREFAGPSEDELRFPATFADEVAVPAGTVVAQLGGLCHEFVIVASGELDTCRSGRSGRLGRGDTFGSDAMRERGVSDATVRATSAARLLVMSH